MVYHLAASKAPDTWYHGVPSGSSEPAGAWSGSAENDSTNETGPRDEAATGHL